MPDYKLHLQEIISMTEKILNSVSDKTIEEFANNSDLFDATLMRLHFIGETIKAVPFSLKKDYKKVRWRKFARLRNLISHRYGRINKIIIWDIISKLPELKAQMKEILEAEK